MKPLKPSMREKKRYLLVKGQIKDVEKAILGGVGVLGMSKTSFNWIKKNKDSAVISVNRRAVNDVRASFAIWSKNINVVRVSGSLKGLRKSQ